MFQILEFVSSKLSDMRVEYDPTPMMYLFYVCIQDPYICRDCMEILFVDMDISMYIYTDICMWIDREIDMDM